MFYTINNLYKNYRYPLKKKLFIFFKGFILHILFTFISILLIMSVEEFIVKTLNFPSVYELFKKSNLKITKHYNFFLVVIFLPLIEELFFRLPLIPSRRNITIFSFLLSILICYGGKYPQKIDLILLISISISLIISIAIYYIIKNNSEIEKIFHKVQKPIIIISILTFGLIHLGNIDKLYIELILFYPIYVLPQISIGYFCSILRLKFGFLWGILFHSLINLMGYCLTSL